MYEWTILENHIHELPSFDARLLSYAQTHFWYFIKLIYPRYLCFDYGFDCIPTITSYMDWRNLLPLSVYGLFFGSLYSMFYYFKLSLILSFGCFFLPSD
ncbi:DUF1736 domain-containing protein, partial [Patescibacteria group bacterium]|nr:DUF1736 domain-containing protein [Patescibacteria group bacterium]